MGGHGALATLALSVRMPCVSAKRKTLQPKRTVTSRGNALVDIRTGQRFPLKSSGVQVVGNSRAADICLSDETLSALHCDIRATSSGHQITEKCARNQIVVNGVMVQTAQLKVGDKISLGSKTLQVMSGQELTQPKTQLIGSSRAMQEVARLITHAASSHCSVLILGETGSGKELVAQSIHALSKRKHAPFVPVNCGALPEALVASELFGAEKGSFTGASSHRTGLFQQSNKGTIFLDELGEMPIHLQPYLLRVLETGVVRPVGSTLGKKIDFRVIAATNKIPTEDSFSSIREDLFYRVGTFIIKVPPLRHRLEDIEELAEHFLRANEHHYGKCWFSPHAMSRMKQALWPGNVRELRGNIIRAMAMEGPGELSMKFIWTNATHQNDSLSTIQKMIRDRMTQALHENNWNMRAAAKSIGMPSSTFADRAKRFCITRPNQ